MTESGPVLPGRPNRIGSALGPPDGVGPCPAGVNTAVHDPDRTSIDGSNCKPQTHNQPATISDIYAEVDALQP
jgi:hypothetical protein